MQLTAVVFLSLLLWSVRAEAACSSTGANTWQAAGRDVAHFEECEDAAANGDTVVIPAGSVTWSAGTDLREKDIKWVGGNGTAGQVTINYMSTAGTIINIRGRCSSLSGFELVANYSRSNAMVIAGDTTCGTNRIHHNTFRNTNLSSYPDGLSFRSAYGGAHTTGLVDNNTFIRTRTSIRGGDDNNHTNAVNWRDLVPFGSSSNVVYYEDNTCYFTKSGSGSSPCLEPHHGGRVVARFNIIDCAYLEAHGGGGEGQARSSQHVEFYLNQFRTTQSLCNSQLPRMLVRGGGIYIWGNMGSSDLSRSALVKVDADGREGTPGRCDGTSAEDGNNGSGTTFPPAGYPCIDMPGRVQDLSAYDGTKYTARGQKLQPVALFWNRKKSDPTKFSTSGSELPVVFPHPSYYSTSTVKKDGVDYYANYALEGVNLSIGPIASRPTCSDAVTYYWATDEGDWNAGSNSFYTGQGKLYYCDPVTDTWDSGREPYTYPHPSRVVTSDTNRTGA